MNCQKFESVAGELARGQMMQAEVRNDALAHSSDCATCSSLLRDEEMLTHGLRALAAEMSSVEAPPSMESRLLSAFRQREVVVPIATRAVRSNRHYWIAAVAAMLLVVLGLVAFRSGVTGTQPEKQTAAAPKTKLNEAPSPEVTQDNTTSASDNVLAGNPERHRNRVTGTPAVFRPRSGRSRSSNVVANHAVPEVATDFMPIGYMNANTFQDGGQIVRVELPRGRLASFGIPVNMDRYNERVKADILLGVDGTARAIRFVQEKRLE